MKISNVCIALTCLCLVFDGRVADATVLDAGLLSKFQSLISESQTHWLASLKKAIPSPANTSDAGVHDAFSFFSADPAGVPASLQDYLQNQTAISLRNAGFNGAVTDWSQNRAKLASTPAEKAFWTAPLIGKLLVLADSFKDAEQSVRDAYFAFWVSACSFLSIKCFKYIMPPQSTIVHTSMQHIYIESTYV